MGLKPGIDPHSTDHDGDETGDEQLRNGDDYFEEQNGERLHE